MAAPVQPDRIGRSGPMLADLPLIFAPAQQCDEDIRFGAMTGDFGEWRIGIVDWRVALVGHASVDERPVAGQIDGARMQPHGLTQVAFGAGAGSGEYLRPFFRTGWRAVNRSSIAGQHGGDGRDGSGEVMREYDATTLPQRDFRLRRLKPGGCADPRRECPHRAGAAAVAA